MDKNEIKELIKSEKFIIYGAGRIGMNTIQMLRENEIETKIVFDKNEKKAGTIEGATVCKPVYKPEWKEYLVIISVFGSGYVEEELKKLGYEKIIQSEELSNYFFFCSEEKKKNHVFDVRACNKCVVEGRGCQEYQDYYLTALTPPPPRKVYTQEFWPSRQFYMFFEMRRLFHESK